MKRLLGLCIIFCLFCSIGLATPTVSIAVFTHTTKTNDTNATFTVSADANKYCISTSTSCTPGTDVSGTNFTVSISSLLTNDTNNVLYAFVSDANAVLSSASSDWVLYDASGPTYTVYPADGGDYNTTSFTFDINFSDTVGGVTSLLKLDTSTTITDGQSLSSLSEGTHTITVDANDSLGNQTTGTVTFRVDTTAPTDSNITTSYKTSYTNDETPDIVIKGADATSGFNGGRVRLSCTSSGLTGSTYYETGLTGAVTTISSFDITASSYDCNSADGNKLIFAKVRDKAGNWISGYASNSILYDNTAPEVPIMGDLTAGNGTIKIDWDAPSSSDVSGINKYHVYGKKGTGSYSQYGTTTNTFYDANNLSNTYEYCFQVSADDNAGNEGTKGEEKCATPESVNASISVERNGASVSYAKSGSTLDVGCTFSDTVSSAKIYTRYYPDSASVLYSTSSSTTSISDSFSIDDGYDTVQVWCTGDGVTSSTKTINIDDAAPTIAWQDTNATFAGVRRIYVTTADDHMDRVEFLLGSVTYVASRVNDTNYYIDINTQQIENGSYTLKATAIDLAGNTKDTTRTINVSNILSETQVALKAIKDAQTKKGVVEDTIAYLSGKGIILNQDIQSKKAQADSLLIDANSKVTTDINGATLAATNALELYTTINASLVTETKVTQQYELTEGKVQSALTGLGFSPEDAARAESTSKNTHRTLTIIHVGTGDEYQATIELTIKNDTNSDSIKVIEIIPKEFAQNASALFSDTNFIILQGDPIIEFDVNLAPGTSTTLTYGGGIITKTQSENMELNKVLDKFAAQPIILESTTDTKKIIDAANVSGLLFFIVEVVIVLAVLGVLAFVGMRVMNKQHGFGGEKTPLEKKEEESWPKVPENKP